MFNIIESYFKDNDYYIIICNDKLYIRNYSKILELTETYILIEINNTIYKFIGNSFSLIKNCNQELEIKGNIESFDKI